MRESGSQCRMPGVPRPIDGSVIDGVKAIERRPRCEAQTDERSHATECVSVTFGRGCVTGGRY